MPDLLGAIREIEKFDPVAEINRRFKEVIDSCVSSPGKKGTVTIKVAVSSDEEGQVDILPEIDHKCAKPKRTPSTFFIDEENGGQLVRHNPARTMFDVVEGENQEQQADVG